MTRSFSPSTDMFAMLFEQPQRRLRAARIARPAPKEHEAVIHVAACGVSRTDLQIVQGQLPAHRLPLVLGHAIVGVVVAVGAAVSEIGVGDRVGVPWLATSCGNCGFCGSGRENLCNAVRFTGYDRDGGFAEFVAADARYCLSIPERYDALHAAPLLSSGLFGYRAYAMTGEARRIGLYGFGEAARIIAQLARHQGREIYAFTPPGDARLQEAARALGAAWAGDFDRGPLVELDAAIIFNAAGALLPKALATVKKGGIVVCAGIDTGDVPSFPYVLLAGERTVHSVGTPTREDGQRFFALADECPLTTSPRRFVLSQANEALDALRENADGDTPVLLASQDE